MVYFGVNKHDENKLRNTREVLGTLLDNGFDAKLVEVQGHFWVRVEVGVFHLAVSWALTFDGEFNYTVYKGASAVEESFGEDAVGVVKAAKLLQLAQDVGVSA